MTSITDGEDGLSVRNKLNALLSLGVNPQAGSTYTVIPSDEFKLITFANAATVTVPSGLGAGFRCRIAQLGIGEVTVVAGSGVTLNALNNTYTLAGQYATATLAARNANDFLLAGQLAGEPVDIGDSPVTSAGVFDSNGRLVRTLWSAQANDPRVADPVAAWDGKIDTFPPGGHSIAPTGTYTIKVLGFDLQYQWDGVVGNTSPNHVDNMYYHNEGVFITDLEITDAGEMYYTTGYNERWPCCSVSTEADPQVMNYPIHMGFRTSYSAQYRCCTDGTLAYFGYIPGNFSGVYAVKCSDKTIHPFASGAVLGDFQYCVDIRSTGDISSLAVQKTGNYLFLACSSEDRLDVIHKTTGALAQSVVGTYNAIVALATSPTTGDLWAAYSPGAVTVDTIIKLTVNASTGALTPSGVSITVSGGNIVSLAVSPDGATLLAIDGGAAQQVRAFNTSNGSVKTEWGNSGTLGAAGGYSTTPVVSNTRFMFLGASHFTTAGASAGWVAYSSGGSFWIGDVGNERALHFSAGNSPTYIKQVAYNGAYYSCQVDRTDPTRVTVNYLEYQINYAQSTLTPTNGSWVLLNNWAHGMSWELNYFTRLEFLGTYSNGRRYASVYDASVGMNRIYELTSTGMRNTGATFTRGNSIDADFNLNSCYHIGTSPTTWQIKLDRKLFTGFDGSHNPTWGAWVNVMTSEVLDLGKFPPPNTDPNMKKQSETTANGVLPIVQMYGMTPESGNDYGRLGGLDLATGTVKYDTWPQTPKTYGNQITLLYPEGPFFPHMASYAGGPYFFMPGHNNLFTTYRGEEWGNNQTSVVYHWHESGLLLGTFGKAAPYFGADSLTFPKGHFDSPAIGPMTVGVPNRDMSFKGMIGLTGNTGWGGLTYVNGVYYVYLCDEWYHGGLPRWSVRGMNTLKQASFTVNWNSASYVAPNDPTDLLQGLPFASLSVPNAAGGWTRSPATNSTTHGIWTVRTNEILADPHVSPDLAVWFAVSQASEVGPNTVSRAIPRVGSGNWSIDSKVFFVPGYRTALAATGNSEMFIDVLDNTDKIIVRIENYHSGPTEGGLLVNETKITPSTGFVQDWRSICGAVKPLTIQMNVSTGKMVVTYDTFSISDVSVFEAGAAPGSPAKFQITGKAFGSSSWSGVSNVTVFTKLNYIEG